MPWKPEYAEARKVKARTDPQYRAKRNSQATADPEARKQYMAEYYKANPDKFGRKTPEKRAKYNEARRRKYAEDTAFREAHKATVKEWQDANPQKRKAQRIKKYDIDLSDFNDLMATQNGRCAICGHSDTSNPKLFPVVDHCHTSGRVRGLLCMACNQGLGKFRDNVDLLMTAAAYIAKHG